MGTGYDPTQFVDGVDTGKIRRARRFVSAMRKPGIGYSLGTLVDLAEAIEEAGRAEEAVKVRKLADPLIDKMLMPINKTVIDTQQSGDLLTQCLAFLYLEEKLRHFGRIPQADSAYKSAEELSDRIFAIVRQEQHEPAELYSWVAGLYSKLCLKKCSPIAARNDELKVFSGRR